MPTLADNPAGVGVSGIPTALPRGRAPPARLSCTPTAGPAADFVPFGRFLCFQAVTYPESASGDDCGADYVCAG